MSFKRVDIIKKFLMFSIIFAVRGYDHTSINKEGSVQSDAVRELFSRKQTLLLELKNYSGEGGQNGIPVSVSHL